MCNAPVCLSSSDTWSHADRLWRLVRHNDEGFVGGSMGEQMRGPKTTGDQA
jgi:hypothetical protein